MIVHDVRKPGSFNTSDQKKQRKFGLSSTRLWVNYYDDRSQSLSWPTTAHLGQDVNLFLTPQRFLIEARSFSSCPEGHRCPLWTYTCHLTLHTRDTPVGPTIFVISVLHCTAILLTSMLRYNRGYGQCVDILSNHHWQSNCCEGKKDSQPNLIFESARNDLRDEKKKKSVDLFGLGAGSPIC